MDRGQRCAAWPSLQVDEGPQVSRDCSMGAGAPRPGGPPWGRPTPSLPGASWEVRLVRIKGDAGWGWLWREPFPTPWGLAYGRPLGCGSVIRGHHHRQEGWASVLQRPADYLGALVNGYDISLCLCVNLQSASKVTQRRTWGHFRKPQWAVAEGKKAAFNGQSSQADGMAFLRP